MKIIGKVHVVTNKVEGESENGFWVRQELVVEMPDSERKLCFTATGEEKCSKIAALPPETMVEVDFLPESNFFKDKWFTKLKLINVKRLVTG